MYVLSTIDVVAVSELGNLTSFLGAACPPTERWLALGYHPPPEVACRL
jgi:hypothetical protein